MLLEKEIQERIEEARKKGTLAKLLLSSVVDNQPEIIIQFLKQPGKVTAEAIKSLQIASVLQAAAKKNWFELVSLLLEKYGKIDNAIKILFIPRLLAVAASNNLPKVIEQIINTYKDVSLGSLGIFEMLEGAAAKGHNEIVKLLLEHWDSDANKIDNLAIPGSWQAIIADYDKQAILRSLRAAAYNGHLKVVAQFLEYYNKDANQIDSLIARALGAAAEADQIEVEIYILRKYNNDPRLAEIETLEDVAKKIKEYILYKIESKDMNGMLSLIKAGFSTGDKTLLQRLIKSDILKALELQKTQPEVLEAIKLIHKAKTILFIKRKKTAIKTAQVTLKHSAAILTDLQQIQAGIFGGAVSDKEQQQDTKTEGLDKPLGSFK